MTMEHRRHLAALAETLHGERRLLERHLFKLVEARLVLAADEARFLPFAMAEVEEVVERVRFGESYRRRAVKELAEAIAEGEERITLAFLASWAPEPYRTMFAEHRDQFMRLTTEIERASVDCGRLANSGAHRSFATGLGQRAAFARTSPSTQAGCKEADLAPTSHHGASVHEELVRSRDSQRPYETAAGDVSTTWERLEADFVPGHTAGAQPRLDAVKGQMERLKAARAPVDAAAKRIESPLSRSRADDVDLRATASEREDTDMAGRVMEMQVQWIAYQAAQVALARSIQPSLAQFLR